MKILSSLLKFLGGLIFDHEEEYDINSAKFNTKKVLFTGIFVISFVGFFFVTWQFIGLGSRYLELQQQIVAANNKITELTATSQACPKTSNDLSRDRFNLPPQFRALRSEDDPRPPSGFTSTAPAAASQK